MRTPFASAREALYDFPARNVLQPHQRVAADRHSPLRRAARHRRAVGLRPCGQPYPECRNCESSEGRPHHGGWRNVASRELGVGGARSESPMRTAAPAPSPPPRKKSSLRAVGRRDTNGPIAAGGDFAFLVLPFEHNVAMTRRQIQRGERPIRRKHAFQRRSGGRARDRGNERGAREALFIVDRPW